MLPPTRRDRLFIGHRADNIPFAVAEHIDSAEGFQPQAKAAVAATVDHKIHASGKTKPPVAIRTRENPAANGEILGFIGCMRGHIEPLKRSGEIQQIVFPWDLIDSSVVGSIRKIVQDGSFPLVRRPVADRLEVQDGPLAFGRSFLGLCREQCPADEGEYRNCAYEIVNA